MLFAETDWTEVAKAIAIVLGAIGALAASVFGAVKGWQKVIYPLWVQWMQSSAQMRRADAAAADKLEGGRTRRLLDQYQEALEIKEKDNQSLRSRIEAKETQAIMLNERVRILTEEKVRYETTAKHQEQRIAYLERRLAKYENGHGPQSDDETPAGEE